MNCTFLSIFSSSSTATVIYYIRKIIFELLFFSKVKEVRRSRNSDPSIWNIHLKVCKFLIQLRQNIIVPGLGRYLEQEMATYSWEIPWTEEPGWLQFIGSQRVRCDLVTKQTTATILIPHVMTGVCVQVYAFFKTHQRVHSRFFHCVHWGVGNV